MPRMSTRATASIWKWWKLGTTSGTRATRPCPRLGLGQTPAFRPRSRWLRSRESIRLEWTWRNWKVTWVMALLWTSVTQTRCVTRARSVTPFTMAKSNSTSPNQCKDCPTTSSSTGMALRTSRSTLSVDTSSSAMKQTKTITCLTLCSVTTTGRSACLGARWSPTPSSWISVWMTTRRTLARVYSHRVSCQRRSTWKSSRIAGEVTLRLTARASRSTRRPELHTLVHEKS